MLTGFGQRLEQGGPFLSVAAEACFLVRLLGAALWLTIVVRLDFCVAARVVPAVLAQIKEFLKNCLDGFALVF